MDRWRARSRQQNRKSVTPDAGGRTESREDFLVPSFFPFYASSRVAFLSRSALWGVIARVYLRKDRWQGSREEGRCGKKSDFPGFDEGVIFFTVFRERGLALNGANTNKFCKVMARRWHKRVSNLTQTPSRINLPDVRRVTSSTLSLFDIHCLYSWQCLVFEVL